MTNFDDTNYFTHFNSIMFLRAPIFNRCTLLQSYTNSTQNFSKSKPHCIFFYYDKYFPTHTGILHKSHTINFLLDDLSPSLSAFLDIDVDPCSSLCSLSNLDSDLDRFLSFCNSILDSLILISHVWMIVFFVLLKFHFNDFVEFSEVSICFVCHLHSNSQSVIFFDNLILSFFWIFTFWFFMLNHLK